jgi:hypothetical protein
LSGKQERSDARCGCSDVENPWLNPKGESTEAGIGDVQLYEVLGGYLALAAGQVERTDGQIPDCLEIVGSKDALQTFVDLYRPLLGSRHIVLLTHQESQSCARWPPGLV